MHNVHSIIKNITDDHSWKQKFILGSLLSFIPIINFFAFGYLHRYAQQILNTGSVRLPEWDHWPLLFKDGFKFFLLLLIYAILPISAGYISSHLISNITLNLLGWIPFLPLSIALIASPILFVLSLYSSLTNPNQSIFLVYKNDTKQLLKYSKFLILPSLALLGLLIVGLPFYGFAFFTAFVIMIAYSMIFLLHIENSNDDI